MKQNSPTSPQTAPRSASSANPAPVSPVVRGVSALGSGMVKRLFAVVVVIAMLAIPYASSLRVYLRQQAEIATAREQIAQREREIGTLQDEVERWRDPNYVKAQARNRLGWVVPGETGYRVIGADGKPLGGGAQIDNEGELPDGEHPTVWWDRAVGSVKAADQPAPREGEASPASPKTIKPPSSAQPSSAKPTPKR